MKIKKNNINQLRIIGGKWRGRKINFAEAEGLRPTTDRIRETLFNWLQLQIAGARCLDLFSGSGALAFEALSREAQAVELIEKQPSVARQLREELARLECSTGNVTCTDASTLLQKRPPTPFDIIFLDPPFRKGLLQECCNLLEKNNWLSDEAYIYLESELELGLPELPKNWELIRSKKAGQVGYHLARRTQPNQQGIV